MRMLLAALMLFAAVSCSFSGSDRFDGEYELPVDREFPVISDEDVDNLQSAMYRFFAAPEWASAKPHIRELEFGTVAVLTKDGDRAGVYGNALFSETTDLHGPLVFLRCGRTETWMMDNGSGRGIRAIVLEAASSIPDSVRLTIG